MITKNTKITRRRAKLQFVDVLILASGIEKRLDCPDGDSACPTSAAVLGVPFPGTNRTPQRAAFTAMQRNQPRRFTTTRLTKRGTWSEPQRKWLERIGKAVVQVGVADRAVLDEGQFRAAMGGFDRLNRIFEGRLDAILGDINEELWRKSA